jgi:ParB family chromosome partitioning protein
MVGSDVETQRMLYNDILTIGINSRDAEIRAREIIGRPLKSRGPKGITAIIPTADPELRLAQARLEETLGTRVLLHRSGDKGKIVVEFFSDEELKSILQKIIHEA